MKVVLDYKPDCLIAIGGGSVIDSAKAIREFSVKMDESEKIALIAIPTTSGTGSEVTAFSVITDSVHHIKYPLVSESMLPEEAILDEEFVKSVPPNVTADTGMDVLTHAVEAYTSINNNEFSAALAEKAIGFQFGVARFESRNGASAWCKFPYSARARKCNVTSSHHRVQ